MLLDFDFTPRQPASEAYEKAYIVLVAILFLVLNIMQASITYDTTRTDCGPLTS